MIRAHLVLSVVVVCICAVGFAQDVRSAVGISADGVRFLSSGPIVAMRVEVLSPGGTALYDSDWKSGNVLDWMTPVLPYGAYPVRLFTKDLEGRVSEKQATLHVAPEGMSIDPAAASDLKMTATLHDGEMGQLVTTSGDLSFRFGDYLNRKDSEAMRLTAGGELQVKGLIRTGEGIMFPDGSVQRSAAMPSIVRMQPVSGDPQRDGLHPRSNTTGTGTTNQITKWLDTSGTLGDSAISESAGAVTIGSIAAQGQLQIAGSATQDVFAGMGPNIVSGPAMNYGYAGLSFGRGAGFFNVRPDAQATAPNPSLRFMTRNVQRMIITNLGDVGVNTLAPAAKFHLVGADGASDTSGFAAPDALRVVGGTGGAGTSGSGGAGGSIVLQGGTGGGGTGFGGSGGSIILEPGLGGNNLGLSSGNVILADTGGLVGIGTATPSQRLDVNGNAHLQGSLFALSVNATASVSGASGSFTGNIVSTGGAVDAATQFNIAGQRVLSDPGSNNLFIGVSAGAANVTGSGDTFVGASAGNSNTAGNLNSYFGYQSGLATTGSGNSFFGSGSGQYSTTGFGNSAFGWLAGRGQVGATGAYNCFFGDSSGTAFTTGSSNAAFGDSSAYQLTSGYDNAFFGAGSGSSINTGFRNTLIGAGAGHLWTTESGNTMLGYHADGAPGITNATAVGKQAYVLQSNSLILGSINGVNDATSSTNVGIGTMQPWATLDVRGGSIGVGVGLAPDWASQANAIFVNNDGGDVGNFMRIDGANDSLYLIARSAIGSTHGTNIRLLTAPASGGELERLTIDQDGLVAIPNLGAAGSTALCRNASNQIATCSSSIRYKDSIGTFGRGLDLIRQLHPVTFRWKDDGKTDVGLIAEEVEKVEPLLTVYNAEGKVEGVKYDHLTVALINAVQEQQQENALLRDRLEKLEKVVAELKRER